MVVVPVPVVFAKPATLGAFAIVATLAEDELQCVVSVMSWVVASLNDPVAVNCCWLPSVTDEFAGVITNDTSVPVPTVRVVVPCTPEAVAVIVTDPLFLPWHRPELRIEARFGFEDLQVSPLRLVEILPSLKVPVAVNFIDVPFAILGLLGLMVMETRCTIETVRVVEPLTEPNVADIVLVPVATLVTSPWLLIVAVAAVEEAHRTEAVTSCVLLSLKVPVAVNCLFVPTGMLELAGVTAIETRVALVTVSDTVPVTEPEVALMVAVPVPTAVARPEELTVATFNADDPHVGEVSNWKLPSSKFPTAVNCWVVPSAIDGVAGLTEMEIKCAATTVKVAESVSDPTVAVIVVDPAAMVVAMPELLMLATEFDEELQVTPAARS